MNFFTAVNATPPITAAESLVTTNLINYLDFSNTSCYSGSGTTVYDLVASLSYTVNGALFLSGTNGGVFEFDGVNDYIFANSDRTLVGNFSVGVWFLKNGTTGVNMGLFNLEDSSTDGYRHLIDENTGNYYLRSRINANNFDDTTPMADLTWYYFVATWNDSSKLNTAYKNGSSYDTSSPATSLNVVAERICIGAITSGNNYEASAQYHKGYIGEVHFYNRELSAAEVLQNFNATRSRYGV